MVAIIVAFSSRLLKKSVLRPIFSMFVMPTDKAMSGDPRGMRGYRYDIASYSALQTDSSRCSQNLRNANEIVGGGCQYDVPCKQSQAAMSHLGQAHHNPLTILCTNC